MDVILRAENMNYLPGEHGFSPAELGVVLHWRDPTGVPKFNGENMPQGLSRQVTTEAHISYGRWVADCPTPGCHAASYVSPDDPRIWCTLCENRAAGGKWATVIFPTKATRLRVEELLSRRALAEHRTWYPYETIADLQRENHDHGVDAT